jgi:hypothetical protein
MPDEQQLADVILKAQHRVKMRDRWARQLQSKAGGDVARLALEYEIVTLNMAVSDAVASIEVARIRREVLNTSPLLQRVESQLAKVDALLAVHGLSPRKARPFWQFWGGGR